MEVPAAEAAEGPALPIVDPAPTLRAMLAEGDRIATHRSVHPSCRWARLTGCPRTDDLFRSLEGRALTAEEDAIITARVALQRKMAGEFERRERIRKARLLRLLPGGRMRRPPARAPDAPGRRYGTSRACAGT